MTNHLSKFKLWIAKRGVWGIVAVVAVTLLFVVSGVGVTVAATGGFSAKKTVISSPSVSFPTTPSGTRSSQPTPNPQVTQSVKTGSGDAGQNFVPYGEGFNVLSGPNGIQFSYLGPCLQVGGLSVVTNTGKTITTSPGCTRINPKGLSGATMFNWEGNFSHYCHSVSPNTPFYGGATAVRAEIFGVASAWVEIPQNYLNCPGAPGPAPVVPEEPVVPSSPEPIPPVAPETSITSDPVTLPSP